MHDRFELRRPCTSKSLFIAVISDPGRVHPGDSAEFVDLDQ
jgi:hypothetical protein